MLRFIHNDFELELTHLKITFSEVNQDFKDDFSTEMSFPFDMNIDANFEKNTGFINHYNASNNKTVFEGILEKDGVFGTAILKVKELRGKKMSLLINSGYQEFPSFNKKLSELPLEQKYVDDIIEDANEVIVLGYPATNYNFPMVHTDKYDPTDQDWNGFEKIINYYKEGDFVENELVEDSNIDLIKNIMQPLPYLMHIIKAGISDAGYTLAGDILQNLSLKNALLFRDGDYYQRLSEESIPIVYKNTEYDGNAPDVNEIPHVTFEKSITIEKKGDYLIFGTIFSLLYRRVFINSRSSKVSFSIAKVSGGVSTILLNHAPSFVLGLGFDMMRTVDQLQVDIEASFNPGDMLVILKTEAKRDSVPSETPDYPDAINLELIPVRYRNPDGSPIISVLNLNEIDLTRVVPDMTFRDLIVVIKNWFNYSWTVNGSVVSMNLIRSNLDRTDAVSLIDHEVEEPKRTYHEDREFELSFTDGKKNEKHQYDSVLVKSSGITVNNYLVKDSTSPIKIDALPLPMLTRNGVTTAYSFEDENSKLRLVFMKPMPEGATPVAYDNPSVLIPAVYNSSFQEWLNFRINSVGYEWPFLISVEKMKEITINSLTYAYNNHHIFTEMGKERVNQMWWRVTAKTESLL
jgi:hypothetical protein